MFFIFLLIASAIAIAGSAAFFSVYGLAHTFGGVFWSVVIMGASLEAGKLVAASYLYRYWDRTNFLLKTYLFAGVLALMALTSGGIFGYLSSGYQADVLPLKQLETQITLLEDEKGRMIERKKDIDKQISQLPNNYVTARIRLMKEFQEEQKVVTTRIKELDNEILELKKTEIKTEAHIGPITYISKAFDVETDDATKWLVFLIIFAFDPMAIALTLAVNIALRRREEDNERIRKESPPPQPKEIIREVPVDRIVEKEVIKEVPVDRIVEKEVPVERIVEKEVIKEVPVEVEKIVYVDRIIEPTPEPTVEEPEPPAVEVPVQVLEEELKRQIRSYPTLWTEGTSAEEKIEKLLTHFKYLKEKKASGATLNKDETREMKAISEILQRKGFDIYLK